MSLPPEFVMAIRIRPGSKANKPSLLNHWFVCTLSGVTLSLILYLSSLSSNATKSSMSTIPSDYVVYLQESDYNIEAENDLEPFSQAMSLKE
ncbi:hypothetical protein CR513_15805, partial [Mucuna pruriens]